MEAQNISVGLDIGTTKIVALCENHEARLSSFISSFPVSGNKEKAA